jgi:predicted TPR repeat methyltransferase
MTAPLVPFLSSGDLIADRRYHWAIDQLARGDLAGAADILTQALELAPNFATAWFALGMVRDRQGDRAAAVAAFEKARDADPEDHGGARLQLARLGAGRVTPEMRRAYVRRLFDQQAHRFDRSLVEDLAYRGPQLLLTAVNRVLPTPLAIESMLDLGCGTGLAGVAFRPYVNRLVGVDLSAGMIEAARSKNVYDLLAIDDLTAFLMREVAAQAQYALVLAADVFVYCDDLTPIARAVAAVLAPHGLLAFTVETYGGDGAVLQPTLRFAHGQHHVRTSAAAAGLKLLVLEEVSTRTENRLPVPGLLAIAARN